VNSLRVLPSLPSTAPFSRKNRRTLVSMNIWLEGPWALMIGVVVGGLIVGVLWFVARRSAPLEVGSEPVPDGLDTALEVIGAIGVVLDGRNRVIRASRSAIDQGIVDGREVSIPPIARLVERARAAGRTLVEEFEIPRSQQSPQYLIVRVAPLGSQFLLLVADDRSDIYRIDAVRRDFIANISHELKTPIGAVSLLAEALTASADHPVQVRSFAASLEKEAARLAELTSDIIELSRLQSGGRIQNPVPVAIDQVVLRAIDSNRVFAESHGIELAVNAKSSAWVPGDESSLVTAVHNLIRNAITYSKGPGRVGVGVVARNGMVEVSVTDQGIGIPSQELDRIFERFYRGDPARSRQTGGTGLGLSIVKHVVANHDGQVRVWSQPGRGSTFTLKFRTVDPGPIAPAVDNPTVVSAAPAPDTKLRSAEFIATGHSLDTPSPPEGKK
jgi:two-component system, OmpR family, sensor histidine kinase SenX3